MKTDERVELRRLTQEASALKEKVEGLHEVLVGDIKKDLHQIKEYNRVQNGNIAKVMEQCARNSTWITALKWIMGSIVSIMIACLTKLYGVW